MSIIHKATVSNNMCVTVRPKDDAFVVSYEHALYGSRQLSEHATASDAIYEADSMAIKTAKVIPMAVQHLYDKLKREGKPIPSEGPERLMEMAEKGEVTL